MEEAHGKTKQSYTYWQCRNSIPTRRSELISKEVQWQQRQQSLEKKICELEYSLEKTKKSNSSQSKTPNSDKKEITTEMYIIVQRTSLYMYIVQSTVKLT